ncbi:MAG: gliding motility-associated C-terminal domain-containing protein, partial [Hymenobacteraceae bacterium]|nr:gliding motility-associated C-terminal domain-containing protein [Hymenobacteraceae bacterium]
VKGKFFSDFSMIIYNGSGNVVFTSADAATGWDGTFNGERMPAGAYAYLITVKTTGGAEKRRTGTVTLLR